MDYNAERRNPSLSKRGTLESPFSSQEKGFVDEFSIKKSIIISKPDPHD